MSSLSDKINFIKNTYSEMKSEKLYLDRASLETSKEINEKLIEIEKITKSQKLLDSAAKKMRDSAKQGLENLVTTALQYILDDETRFEIEFTNGAKGTGAEFYVVTLVNGKEERLDPITSCGGGYVDVISVALRYAYIKALKEPQLSSYMILDEPGKMVSEEAGYKFAEFVKKMGEMFKMQTIMITHNSAISNVADNHIEVRKVKDCSKLIHGEKGLDSSDFSILENDLNIDQENIDLELEGVDFDDIQL